MKRPDIDAPDLVLRTLFIRRPGVAAVFLAHRMQCLGCPIAPFHTVVDACREYRLDEACFRRDLRSASGSRRTPGLAPRPGPPASALAPHVLTDPKAD